MLFGWIQSLPQIFMGFVVLVGVGVLFLGALAVARLHKFQRLLIYLSYAKLPQRWFPLNYSKEGFHSHFQITTPDNEQLGAWLYYNGLVKEDKKRIVLYLHGNAGTRGQVCILPNQLSNNK